VAQRKHHAPKPAVAAAKPESAPASKSDTTTEKKSAKSETAPRAAAPHASGQHGVASFYWQPQRVAAGGWFNPNAMTAAHKTLPFGTRVRVTHRGNGRSVEVVINDRGPYVAGRIIDLSKAAAAVIGMTGQGIARVAVEVLGR
jgi:rare lipoprotein A